MFSERTFVVEAGDELADFSQEFVVLGELVEGDRRSWLVPFDELIYRSWEA